MLRNIQAFLLKIKTILYRTDAGIPILIALPLLLLAINHDWIFSVVSIDPWIYWGYFNNFSSYIKAFAGTYYGTRLPFIIPGYICYKLFPPLVANYVLHLGYYYIAVFSLYYTSKLTIGAQVGLLSAIVMGLYPFFLVSIGSDYFDGPSIAYFFLTMLFLTLAAKTSRNPERARSKQKTASFRMTALRPGAMLFLAGCAMAALIFSNNFSLSFVPVFIIYYILVNRDNRKYPLIFSVLFAACGFITIMILLGIINKLAGGIFFFFTPSLTYAWKLIGEPNPWKASGISWILNAPWLVLSSIIFISSVSHVIYGFYIRRIKAKSSPLNKYTYIFSISYVVLFVIMTAWELMGSPVLERGYYVSFMTPLMFLAGGSQIAHLLGKMSKSQFFILIIGLIIILILPYYPPFRSLLPINIHILYPTLLYLAVILLILLLQWRARLIGLTSVILLCLFLGAASLSFIGLQQTGLTVPQSPDKMLLATAKSDDIIKKLDPKAQMRFWYSADDPQIAAFVVVTSTHLWGYRLINETFPSLGDYRIRPGQEVAAVIPSGTKIGIFSSVGGAMEKAAASLAEIGLKVKLIEEQRVEEGSFKFTITFIEVYKSD